MELRRSERYHVTIQPCIVTDEFTIQYLKVDSKLWPPNVEKDMYSLSEVMYQETQPALGGIF